MPTSLRALLTVRKVQEFVLVDLLGLLGADDAYLIVAATETSAGIDDRMNVQLRRLGLARELAQALHKLLLEIVGDVILLAKEDYTALGD